MKRANNLFDQITDYANIRSAFLKALRGNRASPSAIVFCKNIERSLATVRVKLETLHCDWGEYHAFQINDPKPRVINVAPFEQRVMHHAIMNVLEPVFERPMICHSYACRKNKGVHAAALYAFHQCKHSAWFLKLDMRHYFDSIDHATLKNTIRTLIKDVKTLAMLDDLIDSFHTEHGKGVPIGNLTSQFFANLYLAGMDHYIIERLRPAAYCRYMDDFALWGDSPDALKQWLDAARTYAASLALTVKPPILGRTAQGLPFLGFLIKDRGVFLLQKSRKRARERMAQISAGLADGSISEEKAAERALSVFAAIKLARCGRFRLGESASGSNGSKL